MAFTDAPSTLQAIAAAFDRAMASPGGIIISCASSSDASALRHRMNYYRRQTRKESRAVRDPGDPMYGASPYDDLVLGISGSDIIIRHRSPFTIKDIAPSNPQTTPVGS